MLAHYCSLCSVNKSPLSAWPLIRADLIECQKASGRKGLTPSERAVFHKRHTSHTVSETCRGGWAQASPLFSLEGSEHRSSPLPFSLQSSLCGSSLIIFTTVCLCLAPLSLSFFMSLELGPPLCFSRSQCPGEMPFNPWSFQYKENQKLAGPKIPLIPSSTISAPNEMVFQSKHFLIADGPWSFFE